MSGDWSALGRQDPVPGDPVRVRQLVGRLGSSADRVEGSTGRLRNVAANGGEAGFEGDYAAPFKAALAELPGELATLGWAYRRCASALSTYAGELESAQRTASTALSQGLDAQWRLAGAQSSIRSLVPPDLQVLASDRVLANVGQSETLLARILDEGLKAQVRQAVQRARFAQSDRSRAMTLADQAAQLRGQAETRAANAIHAALDDSGMRNKPWWEKAWDFASAPFRSWDAFTDALRKLATTLSAIAIIFNGAFLAILASVAGLVVIVDALKRYAQNQLTLISLGLSILMAALPLTLTAILPLGAALSTMALIALITAKLRKPPIPPAGGGTCSLDKPEYCHAPGSNNTSPWELGYQWLTGTGPREQYFRDGDPLTEGLREHEFIVEARGQIGLAIANGQQSGEMDYSLGGIFGPLKYGRDVSTILCAGCPPSELIGGNLVASYLGSYHLEWQVVSHDSNGQPIVEFHVTNSSTINSATHPPVIGYTDEWNKIIGDRLNETFQSGPLSKTTQSIRWTEPIPVPAVAQ